MAVVVIHHHLKPGGVTRVIHSQVKALAPERVKLLCASAELPPPDGHVSVHLIRELAYLEKRKYSETELRNLYQGLLGGIKAQLTRGDVLHVHNPNLGKNPMLVYALHTLAREGWPILNHAHDFAEDRPANMAFLQQLLQDTLGFEAEELMYPNFSHFRFAVLNSSDKERLLGYGIAPERVVWLPNPVVLPLEAHKTDKAAARQRIVKALGLKPERSIVCYPVRAIRRKNIGEFIFLAKYFGEQAEFLITQAPQNPEELRDYTSWKVFCANFGIRLHFEAGTKLNFDDILLGSDLCFTTSVMEGFGMAFLEPWLAFTPVAGRNIDYLTRDFEADGLKLNRLYENLNLPGLESVFFEQLQTRQMKFIQKLDMHPEFREACKLANPWLDNLLAPWPEQEIEHNRQLILTRYSLPAYGNQLRNEYKKLLAAN